MRYRKKLTCKLLAMTILLSLVGLSPVYPQTACYFGYFRPSFRDSTPAGQNFEVSTTVSVICSGAPDAITDIRVDLVDARNPQNVLSKSTYSYPTQPSMTTTLVNSVKAPMETGPWVLQISAYVIGHFSGAALASNQQVFSVLVVPYTPTTTSATTSTPAVITMPAASTTTTSQQVVIPAQTIRTTYTSSEAIKPDNSPYYLIAAFIGLIIVAIGVIARIKRKKRVAKDKTQVY